MREVDIAKALTLFVECVPFTEFVLWENDESPDPLPETYLAVQHVRTLRPTVNLSGTKSRSEGYLQITVAGQKDEFSTPGEETADLISDAFPVGQRIETVGGIITVLSTRVLPGFADDTRWRTPVRIDYRAIPN